MSTNQIIKSIESLLEWERIMDALKSTDTNFFIKLTS